jgi:4-amino-4-deoxy-L-arabinose transferase-like glycosyltransferase
MAYTWHAPNNFRSGPETLRTPGYPLFLAAIIALHLPLQSAIWIQHLMVVALAAAVFLFVGVVLRRPVAALVAGLLMATNPALTGWAHQYMSDVPACAVIVAALFCFQRRAVAAGLLTGLATLIRPIAVGWFVPLAAILALRSWRRALVFAAAALVLPAAWIARNYAVSGVATISSIGGENLLFYRAGSVLALEDKPLLYRLTALQQQSGFWNAREHLKPRLANLAYAEMRADGIDPLQASYAVISRYYGRLGWRILRQHIPETAELGVSALIEMFFVTYERDAERFTSSWLLDLTVVFCVLLFAAACIGIAVLRRDDPQLALFLAVTIAYFALMAAGGEAEVRFAIPFAPAYAIAAGVGIEHCLARRDGSSGPS